MEKTYLIHSVENGMLRVKGIKVEKSLFDITITKADGTTETFSKYNHDFLGTI